MHTDDVAAQTLVTSNNSSTLLCPQTTPGVMEDMQTGAGSEESKKHALRCIGKKPYEGMLKRLSMFRLENKMGGEHDCTPQGPEGLLHRRGQKCI